MARGDTYAFTDNFTIGVSVGPDAAGANEMIVTQDVPATVIPVIPGQAALMLVTYIADPPGLPKSGSTVRMRATGYFVSPVVRPPPADGPTWAITGYAQTPDFPFPFAILMLTNDPRVLSAALTDGFVVTE